MVTSYTSLAVKVVTDVLCLLVVSIPAIVFKWGGIEPYHRGFFCDDESLKKPARGTTVPIQVTLSVGIILNLVSILIIEGLRCRFHMDNNAIEIGKKTINTFFVNSYKYIGIFTFSGLVTLFFTDVGKFSTGVLRPNFFAVCKPDYGKFNCSDGYIEADVCTASASKVRNLRLSFPSNSSSTAFFLMFYFTVYLQARMRWKGSNLLKHTLQVTAMIMSYFCAASRVMDYKHHWYDVVAGALLGLIIPFCVIITGTDMIRQCLLKNDKKAEIPRSTSITPCSAEDI